MAHDILSEHEVKSFADAMIIEMRDEIQKSLKAEGIPDEFLRREADRMMREIMDSTGLTMELQEHKF